MTSVSQYEDDIKKYKLLKASVNAIISDLNMASNNADDLGNDIRNVYQINENDTPLTYRATKLKNNITSTRNFLINKIIPAIDMAIYGINRNITRLENEKQAKTTKRSR